MKHDFQHNIVESDLVFNFQPELTQFLDGFEEDFTSEHLHKITLWKVNRFPLIDQDVIEGLNSLKCAKLPDDVELVKTVLAELLRCKGVQLPMASTYLRFRNPNTFQIIDQRVYRLLYGEKMKLPGNYSTKNHPAIINIYLQYLDDLRMVCDNKGVSFSDADRVFYTADKRINKASKLSNY